MDEKDGTGYEEMLKSMHVVCYTAIVPENANSLESCEILKVVNDLIDMQG